MVKVTVELGCAHTGHRNMQPGYDKGTTAETHGTAYEHPSTFTALVSLVTTSRRHAAMSAVSNRKRTGVLRHLPWYHSIGSRVWHCGGVYSIGREFLCHINLPTSVKAVLIVELMNQCNQCFAD